MDIDYRAKYLKYKAKYIDLKAKVHGGDKDQRCYGLGMATCTLKPGCTWMGRSCMQQNCWKMGRVNCVATPGCTWKRTECEYKYK